MSENFFVQKPMLERSVLTYSDAYDQPKGKYYVIIDSGAQSMLIVADAVAVSPDQIILTDTNGRAIAQFSPRLPWHAIDSRYAVLLTTAEIMRQGESNNRQMRDYEQELTKEAKTDEGDEPTTAEPLRAPQLISTGQYL